jgi:hypothetical protein
MVAFSVQLVGHFWVQINTKLAHILLVSGDAEAAARKAREAIELNPLGCLRTDGKSGCHF